MNSSSRLKWPSVMLMMICLAIIGKACFCDEGCNQDCASRFIIILISLLFWRQEAVMLGSLLYQASYTKIGELLAPAVITHIPVAYLASHHSELMHKKKKNKENRKMSPRYFFLTEWSIASAGSLVLITRTVNHSGTACVKHTKYTVVFSHGLWNTICEIFFFSKCLCSR